MRDPPDSAVLKAAVCRSQPLVVCPSEADKALLRQRAPAGAEPVSGERTRTLSLAERIMLTCFRALAAWPH